jgi:hypothetical protein
MIKVYFSNFWGESSNDLLHRYSKQTPGCLGIWKNIIGTNNIKEADYCILLENDSFSENFDKSKIIYVKREPFFIKNNRIEYIPYKNIIHWDEQHCGVTWWLGKTYDELKALQYPEKKKAVSYIVSSKHEHRNKITKRIIMDSPYIDLYGRGHDKSIYGESYIGELNYDGNCKFNGLIDYKYSIVLENSQEKNYWTEKLADAYLSWCVPIYFGCPNINEFFDKNSYNILDLNNYSIDDIINKPIDISVLTDSRNKILNEYNIWEVVYKKVMELE